MGCFSTFRQNYHVHHNYIHVRWFRPDTKRKLPCRFLVSTYYSDLQISMYDLVSNWNHEFLSQNPDFVIRSTGRKVSSYKWYSCYADLTLTPREIEKRLREEGVWHDCTEYRDIGIDIACDEENNKALPYPIKICNSKPESTAQYYQKLPASKSDPYQGCD